MGASKLFSMTQSCARVLLEEPDRRNFLKRFRRPVLENMQRQALSKAVNTMARKVVYCPYCSATNGAVKKAGALKIIHDKFRAKKTADELEKFKESFASAVEAQKELGMYINKAVHEDLNPLKVLDLFRRISDEVRGDFVCFWTTDIEGMCRTANYLDCTPNGVGLRSSSGSTSPSPQSVSDPQSLRTAPRTKTISL